MKPSSFVTTWWVLLFHKTIFGFYDTIMCNVGFSFQRIHIQRRSREERVVFRWVERSGDHQREREKPSSLELNRDLIRSTSTYWCVLSLQPAAGLHDPLRLSYSTLYSTVLLSNRTVNCWRSLVIEAYNKHGLLYSDSYFFK